MNNQQKTSANHKDNRRYKYGSISVVFTAVFLVLVIAVNIFFSSLSLTGDLTVDLTLSEYTVISDATISLLDSLGEELDVTITLMNARDNFVSNTDYYGLDLTAMCRDLIENYANHYDGGEGKGNIEVQYKELDTDPKFENDIIEKYGTTLRSESVIIEGRYYTRILNINNFFVIDEEGTYYTQFEGENRLTNAIYSCSIAEKQVVSFTWGQGEPLSDGDFYYDSEAFELAAGMEEQGFEIKSVNLETDEIDPRTRLLITYDPKTDFTPEEIDKIDAYTSARNAYIVFVDSGTPADLYNLQDFLDEYWGINYKPNYCVTDASHSTGAYENIIVQCQAVESDSQTGSAAYNIYKTVEDFGGSINVVMPNSVELTQREKNTRDQFFVETVFTTHDTGVSTNGTTGEKGSEGEIPLMLLSSKQGYGENNVEKFSYVMLVGSTEFASSDILAANIYGNERVVKSAARLLTLENVASDIYGKEFVSAALAIDNGTARTLTWVICTVVPGIIIILGIAMYFRRRHL